jgi:hypothetical protein
MEDSLTSANFEPVTVEPSGTFIFQSALDKLRRSIVGLHNKIFPVYVMDTNIRPIKVFRCHFTTAVQTQQLTIVSAQYSYFIVGYAFYNSAAIASAFSIYDAISGTTPGNPGAGNSGTPPTYDMIRVQIAAVVGDKDTVTFINPLSVASGIRIDNLGGAGADIDVTVYVLERRNY